MGQVLGVDNDDDAMKALAQVIAALRTAQEQASEVARATSTAPDPEVSTGCQSAVNDVEHVLDGLVPVHRKFHRHQRGA